MFYGRLERLNGAELARYSMDTGSSAILFSHCFHEFDMLPFPLLNNCPGVATSK
jgi:hypothetical protein